MEEQEPLRPHTSVDVVVADDHDPVLLKASLSKRGYDMSQAGKGYDTFSAWLNYGSKRPFDNPDMVRAAWDDIIHAHIEGLSWWFDASMILTKYATIAACIHVPAGRTKRSAGYAAPTTFAYRPPRLASTS
jgi:hypothetical protein